MIMTFTQGHRVAKKLELVPSCCIKWHDAAQTFAVVVFVREMTAKKFCKFGEYELFEYLLFLFGA